MNRRTGKRKRLRMQGNQKPNASNNSGETTEKENDDSGQRVPQTVPSRSRVRQPKTRAEQFTNDKHWLDYAIGIFAFIAAIGGVAAAAFSGWQAWISSDNEVRQLRAYVHITGGTISGSGDIQNGPLEISLRPGVKVFGQTPAGGVVVPWALVVDQWPMTDIFPFKYMPPNIPSTSSQAPGEERPIDLKTYTISKEEIAAIKSGTKRLYAYGTILYADVFRNPRYTNFCWIWDLKGIAEKTAGDCPIHNGADWNNSSEPTLSKMQIPMK